MHSIYLNQPRYQHMNTHWLIVQQKAKRDVISIKKHDHVNQKYYH